MIFWILATLAVVIAICTTVNISYEDGPLLGLIMGFLALLGSAAGGFLIFLLACLIPTSTDLISDDTYKLKALGNNSALEGRSYFLGGGYVKEKRVLNFITQRDGGAIRVEQAEAEDSTIFEGSQDTTVRVLHFDHNNGWVAPWPLGSHTEYTFRIPADSVLESYTLDND